jgi:hypothetical protein
LEGGAFLLNEVQNSKTAPCRGARQTEDSKKKIAVSFFGDGNFGKNYSGFLYVLGTVGMAGGRVRELSAARLETISVNRCISISALRRSTFARSTCLTKSNDSRLAVSFAFLSESRVNSRAATSLL